MTADFTAKIFARGDPEKLYECIKPEQTTYERSSFTITKKNDGLEFDIESKDPVALRATLNAIAQMLIVYEKGRK